MKILQKGLEHLCLGGIRCKIWPSKGFITLGPLANLLSLFVKGPIAEPRQKCSQLPNGLAYRNVGVKKFYWSGTERMKNLQPSREAGLEPWTLGS